MSTRWCVCHRALTVVAGNAHGLIDADEGLVVNAGQPHDLFIQVVDVHGNRNRPCHVLAQHIAW